MDTREQKPVFAGRNYIHFKLLCGDYSTMLLRDCFSIERKSPGDLYGTITKGHRRFRDELIRATANGLKLAMYVETTRAKFVSKQFPGGPARKTSGETLGKIMDTVEKRYGLEVVWCSSRTDCKAKIKARLEKEEAAFRFPKLNKLTNENTKTSNGRKASSGSTVSKRARISTTGKAR